MRLRALFLLLSVCAGTASASTVQVAITGTTSAVAVGDGPVFGYSSYQRIPDGTPFTLVYTFDDTRGSEKIVAVDGSYISASQIETSSTSAPGTNATLEIGKTTWEFGTSTRSAARLSTLPDRRSYEFEFVTPERNNRVSVVVRPSQAGYWPPNADWRASFIATSLAGSSGSFSADNGRVSAKGNLVPATIIVNGINLNEQWLRYTTKAGGASAAMWTRQWHLARPSAKGGYIVQQVTRTITGPATTGSAIASTTVKYWEAWRVPANSTGTTGAEDNFTKSPAAAATSSDTISAASRFYEGLVLPSDFQVGKSPYAGASLSSTTDPHLATTNATLPVSVEATLRE